MKAQGLKVRVRSQIFRNDRVRVGVFSRAVGYGQGTQVQLAEG